MAQRSEDGRGLPRGYAGRRRPAVGHAGRGHGAASSPWSPGLVDEHQPLGAQRRLLRAPGAPCGGDVRPVLLGGVRGLFFGVRPQALRKRPIEALRRIGLGSPSSPTPPANVRPKLLQIGAQVRRSVRRIKVATASAWPFQTEYHLAYLYLQRAAAL
jgi:hypothetical protein